MGILSEPYNPIVVVYITDVEATIIVAVCKKKPENGLVPSRSRSSTILGDDFAETSALAEGWDCVGQNSQSADSQQRDVNNKILQNPL